MTHKKGDKRDLMRAIASVLPDAERPTLIGTATYLANNLEWDEPRKRILVGLSDAGVTMEKFAEMQTAAVHGRNDKRRKIKAAVATRKAVEARAGAVDDASTDAAKASTNAADRTIWPADQ